MTKLNLDGQIVDDNFTCRHACISVQMHRFYHVWDICTSLGNKQDFVQFKYHVPRIEVSVLLGSQDSTLSIVTLLWAGKCRRQNLISGLGKTFFSFPEC